MENNNKIDFDENKPYLAPHNPFTLEGHWQPWYDDRRDYGTNAPSYFDYLSNFNHLIKSIVDLVNELAKRDVKTEDTNTIELIKRTSWLVDDLNDIVLKANVKISKAPNNKLTVKTDGLHVETANIDDLKNKVKTLERNFNNHINDFNALKNRVELLDGGGWATKEQLEELRKIIEANRKDYEEADSGLMLIIANIQKRLDALDGISAEIDTWNEKVTVLEAETLNVKNIATMASTLVGGISSTGYSKTPVTTTNVIDNKDRFVCLYNSFTQRINGRITRIERIGFDFSGITTAGASINPVNWTKIGQFTKTDIQGIYGGTLSNNLRRQINSYAFRYYNNYFQNSTDGFFYPWVMRLDYGTDGIFSVWSRGLKSINNKGDIVKPTTEEVYTVITWLDDSGNEYLPKYKPNGDPEDLTKCDPVTPIA